MSGNQNVLSSSSGIMSGSNVSLSGSEKFPSPFLDMSSIELPTTITDMFKYSEYFFNSYGTIRQVSNTVVRYFLTSLVINGGTEKERKSFESILTDDIDLLDFMGQTGDEYMVYGNCFVSVLFPFKRMLVCPKCGSEVILDKMKYSFKINDKKPIFVSKCLGCEYKGEFKVTDRTYKKTENIVLKKWPAKEIDLRTHPITGNKEIYWNIDPILISKVKEGEAFYLLDTPWDIIKAICEGSTMFKFNKNFIYHYHIPSISGMDMRGWGMPPIMPHFRLCYYIMLLRRFDEAIAHDYIIPFRIMSPPHGSGNKMDVLNIMSSMQFRSIMQSVIKRKRKDPTSIVVSPFPIEYQSHGGEAKSLVPKDSLIAATDELLNAMGYPADLYKGSLSIQAFPVALRVFERKWGYLVNNYNKLLKWITDKIINQYRFSKLDCSLRSVTLADDIERKAMVMQAAAGMDMAKSTAYGSYGVDYMDEQKKIVDEQQKVQEIQQDAMAEQQVSQISGSGDGQQPTGPGGSPGATPGDIMEQAKQTAQQLLFQVPENMRRGELIKIKQSNPQLHALVIQEMNSVRQEMARQGQAQVMEQAKMNGGM